MLTAVVVLLRSIGLLCRGHRAVALEMRHIDMQDTSPVVGEDKEDEGFGR